MSMNFFNRHTSILVPFNLQDREIEPEQISFEEENFDPADDRFNYFIPQKSDSITKVNQDMVCTAQNSTHTIFLHFSHEKKYELSINENVYNRDKRLKLKSVAHISLPQLEYQISEEKEIGKERTQYDRQSSTNLLRLQAMSQSQSMIIDSTRNMIITHPKIFHCAEAYLLIDTTRAIYLLNFRTKKITTLINKKTPHYMTVISTFDELYCKEINIAAVKTRTFIFCVDEKETLFYFTLEDGYFEKSRSEIIISKLPFSDLKDIKVLKINHPDEDNNTFSYLIVILTENFLGFYLSEYTNKTLAYFLFRFEALIVSKNIYWNNFHLTAVTKSKNKKIFSFYSKVEKCSIVIVNGYDVIITEFAFNARISELKQKFQLKEGEFNFEQSHRNCNDDNHDAWMTNEFNIKNISKGKLRTRESITKKYPQIKGDGFIFENLSIYDIDYTHYSILFLRGKLNVISRDNLFVLDTTYDIKNSKIFSHILKKDEFINFLNYPEINHIFIACKKNLFKFRFFYKFKFFRENFEKMAELEDSPANDDIGGENFKGMPNYKELISNMENKPMNFSFEEFDKFFKSKIDFLYHSIVNLNMKQKSTSRNEKKLICKRCKVFYSDEEHSEIEWKSFHFFECLIINYLKEMKNYKGQDYTVQCIKTLVKTTEQIILELFKFIEEEIDHREYLIFISLILNLFDKIGILQFIKNILKILDILPQNKPEAKLALQLNKILLVEVSFFYFNLKLLYIKFHFDSGSPKTAAHLLHSFKDLLQILRKDNKSGNDTQKTNKSFNLAGEKTTIKVDKSLLDEKLFKYLADNLYITASNINSNHSAFNNNSSTSLFSTTYNMTNNNLFNNEKEIEIKIFDKFLMYYIDIKSTLMKYDLKIGRFKDQNTCFFLEDIVSNFEDRFTESSINLCYVYFYCSFYLVKINKLSTAVAVLTRAYQIANKEENNNVEMSVSCLYNLGILYSALGAYSEGIHHFEQAHRIIIQRSMSTGLLLQVLHTLSLAYINRKSSRKAFVLIQQSISLINLNNEEEPNNELIKLQSYLNFIIDLIEYDFNTVKKSKNWSVTDMVRNKELDIKKESLYLIEYVLNNGLDMSKQIFEIYSEGFINVLDFLYNCTPEQLAILNADNNQREENILIANNDNNVKDKLDTTAVNNNNTTTTDVTHRDLNQSNILIQNPKNNNHLISLARDKIIDTIDLREEIEIKKPFLNSLSVAKQEILKHLNSNIFKRILILRDPKGFIDHFNLNYHPIHSRGLQKIIESIRANFLIKEISLSQMPNKQDDSDFNYELNSYLYGLAKYLKRPNIKHMLTIEKFRKANPKINSLNTTTKHNAVLTGDEKFGDTHIKNGSLSKIVRKIKFSDFIEIADKIDFDKLEANDFLYEIYSNFDDDYCTYLLDNPEILLNFVFNETKLFSYRKSQNSVKAKNRKFSDQLYDLEEDSSERDEELMHSGSDLSEKSIRKKNNLYDKFTDDLAKEVVKNISNEDSIQRIYKGEDANTIINLLEKKSKLISQDNKIKIPNSNNLSSNDLNVKVSILASDKMVKEHYMNSKSDSEINLAGGSMSINNILKSSINSSEQFKRKRLTDAQIPIASEDNQIRMSSSVDQVHTEKFNQSNAITPEILDDMVDTKEINNIHRMHTALIGDIEEHESEHCKDSFRMENSIDIHKEKDEIAYNYNDSKNLSQDNLNKVLPKFKENISKSGSSRHSNSSSFDSKIEEKSDIVAIKDDPNTKQRLIHGIETTKKIQNIFIIKALNDKRKHSANLQKKITNNEDESLSARRSKKFQKKSSFSFDNSEHINRKTLGFDKRMKLTSKESFRTFNTSSLRSSKKRKSCISYKKSLLEAETTNNNFYIDKPFNISIKRQEEKNNLKALNQNMKKITLKVTTEPFESKVNPDPQNNTPDHINSRFSEVMITEYLLRKNKTNPDDNKKDIERKNSKQIENFTKLNVMEKLKRTNSIVKPQEQDNMFSAIYKTNIKRLYDKNAWKNMKTKENIDDEDKDIVCRDELKVDDNTRVKVELKPAMIKKTGEIRIDACCDKDTESFVNFENNHENDEFLTDRNKNSFDNMNMQISKGNIIVSQSGKEKKEDKSNISEYGRLISNNAVHSEINEDTGNIYKIAPSSKNSLPVEIINIMPPSVFSILPIPSLNINNPQKIPKNISPNQKYRKEGTKSNINLKKLYMNRIEPSIRDTILENINIKINSDKSTNSNKNVKESNIISKIKISHLEEDFSGKKGSAVSKITSNTAFSIFSTQRQENIKLILSKLKTSSERICDSFKNYDMNILNLQTCKLLLPILPNESEQKQLKTYSNDIKLLADSDRFFYQLIEAAPNFNHRIKSIIFKLSFQNEIKELEEKIKNISNNFKFFLEDQRVAEWLQIILAYGNYLNGGINPNKGGVSAFKLNTLNKLSEVKSNDNKKTLLHFVVEWIIEQKRIYLLELNTCAEFSQKIGLKNIKESLDDIRKNFLNVVKLAEIAKKITPANNPTKEFLKDFYEDANAKIILCDRSVNMLCVEYEKVCNFYGENSRDLKYEQFIEIFAKFFSDVQVNIINDILF